MPEPAGQRLVNLYLAAAVIGAIGVIVHFAIPVGSSVYTLVGYLLDILIGVVVVLVAIRAKKTMDRAPLRASLAGAIYSLISGIGNLLFPPSAAALRRAMLQQGSSLTQSQMNAAINLTRSLGMRILELVVALVVGWLLALLVGWIASLFVQGGDQQAI